MCTWTKPKLAKCPNRCIQMQSLFFFGVRLRWNDTLHNAGCGNMQGPETHCSHSELGDDTVEVVEVVLRHFCQA